jgi:hypothetical protein
LSALKIHLDEDADAHALLNGLRHRGLDVTFQLVSLSVFQLFSISAFDLALSASPISAFPLDSFQLLIWLLVTDH